MGHYDSCYDADNKIDAEKQKKKARERHRKVKTELNDIINTLNDDDREFLLHIAKNIKSVKATVELIKKIRDDHFGK